MEREKQLSTTERNRIRQEESKKISGLGLIVAVTRASIHFFSDLDKSESNLYEKMACALRTKNATIEFFTNGKAPRSARIKLIMQTHKLCQEISDNLNPSKDEKVYLIRKRALVQKITDANLAEENMANSAADLMLGKSNALDISNFELVKELEEKILVRKA